MSAAAFARDLLGWKRSPREDGKPKNKVGWEWVPNCADVDSKESISLAAGMLTSLGLKSPGRAQTPATAPPRNPGTALENRVQETLEAELPRLDGNRQWQVIRGALITRYAQYRHLTDLDDLIERYPNLRVTLGKDYLIKPDVTVGLLGTPTRDELPFLHAAVSCKWTIRSDRVQNIRHEFNQMARHRRGRQPHLVTVTAEPLPSRLAAIARGTGEVDATYHIAFDELAQAVAGSGNEPQRNAWSEVVGQGRLMNFDLLARNLAAW